MMHRNLLLTTGGFRIPPYASMRRSVNVDFVDDTGELQFRLLGHRDGFFVPDDQLCFHVRVKPVYGFSQFTDDDGGGERDWGRGGELGFEEGAELVLCSTPRTRYSSTRYSSALRMLRGGLVSVWVISFEKAETGEHGILCCAAAV